jgi:hypothetical protein
MVTHGHRMGGFGHVGLSFLHVRENFIVSSLALCINMLEDQMVDEFGHLLYDKMFSRHPLHDYYQIKFMKSVKNIRGNTCKSYRH